MPAPNSAPIFVRQGVNSSDGSITSTAAMAPTITAAAADYTGVSANNRVFFTADASNGGRCPAVVCKAIGTNVQTVARFYINNGGATTTAANNSFIGEVTLPAITASTIAATPDIIYQITTPLLAPGHRLVVGLGTAVAAGWVFTPTESGKF